VNTPETAVAAVDWPRCEACVFFEECECRHDAPAVITDPRIMEIVDNDRGEYSYGTWSLVKRDAWCGRFIDYATGRTFLEAAAAFRDAEAAKAAVAGSKS